MNTDATTWIAFAVALTIAVALVAYLIRIVAADGYGRNPAPSSRRTDWGTATVPSAPYLDRLSR
jgi:hypothetical protein